MDKEDEKVLTAYINREIAENDQQPTREGTGEAFYDGAEYALRQLAHDFGLDLDSKGNDGE